MDWPFSSVGVMWISKRGLWIIDAFMDSEFSRRVEVFDANFGVDGGFGFWKWG